MTALMAIFAGSTPCRGQGAAGGLRGVVYDAEFGGPVPQAQVRILELDLRMETAEDGHFVFQQVPAGSYTITIAKSGYERLVRSQVVVVPGQLAELEAQLRGEFTEMEEFVVRELKLDYAGTEVGLLAMRETSLSFQDSISSELMSKAGASDAASALKLVAGASVADGKYATVRGLSDRYVGTSINRVRVPSSDPKKRAVQIDIFPAGTIENMTVYKTFTPDLPADWSGGGVDITTLSVPDKPFVKASFSRGVHSRYTGKDGFRSYEGGGAPTWARHGGARDIPDEYFVPITGPTALKSHFMETADEEHPHSEEYLEIYESAKSFAPAMGTKTIKMPEDTSIKVSAGGSFDMGDGWTAGGVGAYTYSRKYDRKDASDGSTSFDATINPGFARSDNLYKTEKGEEEVKLSMLGSVGLKKRDGSHSFNLTAFRTRTATDVAALKTQTGSVSVTLFPPAPVSTNENYDPLVFTEEQTLHYTERSVDAFQLKGRHKWDPHASERLSLEVDWYGARNIAEQDEPDMRYFKTSAYTFEEDGITKYRKRLGRSDTADGLGDVEGSAPLDIIRSWRNTKEDNTQFGLNVKMPFRRGVPDLHSSFLGFGTKTEDIWSEKEGSLKVGLTKDRTRRWFEQKTLGYYYSSAATDDPYPPPDASQVPSYPDPNDYVTLVEIAPGIFIPIFDLPAYNAAVAAWWNSPDGIKFKRVSEDQDEHNLKKYFLTTNKYELWTDHFLGDEYTFIGPYQDQLGWYPAPYAGGAFQDVNYDGFQNIEAGYWMLELPVSKQLKLIGGARLELTDLTIEPGGGGNLLLPVFGEKTSYNNEGRLDEYVLIEKTDSISKKDAAAHIQDSSWFRSMGFVYELAPAMNVRYNWSQTMARPTFRELSPAVLVDFVEDEVFVGNRDLQLVRVENKDLRWEWFPSPGEVFAVSWFYKDIKNPIEFWQFEYNNVDYTTVLNFPEGYVRGWELEGRKKFERPFGLPGALTVGANYTMMDAKVRMAYGQARVLENERVFWIEREDEITEPIERLARKGLIDPEEEIQNTIDGDPNTPESEYWDPERGWPVSLDVWRRMIQQPKNLYNLNVVYDLEEAGTSLGLFYNIVGKTLLKGPSVGEESAYPGYYRAPTRSMSVSLSQKIGDNWKVTLRAKNLNDPVTKELYDYPNFYDEGKSQESQRSVYQKYVSYSVSVGCSW